MNWTKKSLLKAVEDARVGIELKDHISTAIKKFEHHANVNKRFTDHFTQLECHAYIKKNNYSTTLIISKGGFLGMPKAEFRLYVSHVMCASALTWEKIHMELERYSFQARLDEALERLKVIDKEVLEIQEYLILLRSKKFKCFDFYKGIHEVEDALREALS